MNTTLIKTKLEKPSCYNSMFTQEDPTIDSTPLWVQKQFMRGIHPDIHQQRRVCPRGHQWLDRETYQSYRERYDHPLWQKLKHQISDNAFGHGGMDL